jgi:hypothetical protein
LIKTNVIFWLINGPILPKQIANRAIVIYLIALFSVSLLYFSYVMSWGFIALGIICVFAFFGLTVYWTKEWRSIPEKVFVKNIFLIALLIRWIWVVFSFFYYKKSDRYPFLNMPRQTLSVIMKLLFGFQKSAGPSFGSIISVMAKVFRMWVIRYI